VIRRVCADTVGRGCFETKPETDFTTRGLARDGSVRRALLCKRCQADVQREWAEANPERSDAIRNRTYGRHRVEVLRRVAEYEVANRAKLNAARRARYARDPLFRQRALERQARWRKRKPGGDGSLR
jgi:hypothetical protein